LAQQNFIDEYLSQSEGDINEVDANNNDNQQQNAMIDSSSE
jgi:hypothetical protein